MPMISSLKLLGVIGRTHPKDLHSLGSPGYWLLQPISTYLLKWGRLQGWITPAFALSWYHLPFHISRQSLLSVKWYDQNILCFILQMINVVVGTPGMLAQSSEKVGKATDSSFSTFCLSFLLFFLSSSCFVSQKCVFFCTLQVSLRLSKSFSCFSSIDRTAKPLNVCFVKNWNCVYGDGKFW